MPIAGGTAMTRLPTIAEAKAQARRLRDGIASEGRDISHSRALELVAAQHGYRDWNTLHASIGNRPPDGYSVGDQVAGRYLKQPFAGRIRAVQALRPNWFRLVIDLDEAVDVVSFDSFSNLRSRITVSVGPEGRSRERTSDGVPHAELDI